jgi:TctA family transporter
MIYKKYNFIRLRFDLCELSICIVNLLAYIVNLFIVAYYNNNFSIEALVVLYLTMFFNCFVVSFSIKKFHHDYKNYIDNICNILET